MQRPFQFSPPERHCIIPYIGIIRSKNRWKTLFNNGGLWRNRRIMIFHNIDEYRTAVTSHANSPIVFLRPIFQTIPSSRNYESFVKITARSLLLFPPFSPPSRPSPLLSSSRWKIERPTATTYIKVECNRARLLRVCLTGHFRIFRENALPIIPRVCLIGRGYGATFPGEKKTQQRRTSAWWSATC